MRAIYNSSSLLIIANLLALLSIHAFARPTQMMASAHWLTPKTLVIANAKTTEKYQLLAINNQNQQQIFTLSLSKAPQQLALKYSYLANATAFQLDINKAQAKQLIKQQLCVQRLSQPQKQNCNQVQIAPLLDHLFTQQPNDANEQQNFGATLTASTTQFKLWAPTALQVEVVVYSKANSIKPHARYPMTEDNETGIWSAKINQRLAHYYYQYQLSLYHPNSQQYETVTVTDPYSLSLSENSKRSQIIDLTAQETMPNGWTTQLRPQLERPEQQIIYELHIRDFSARDKSLSNTAYRGNYLAFTEKNSLGIKHLKQLKASGLNTIHLLPSFDIGTVDENPNNAIDEQDPLIKVCSKVSSLNVCKQPKSYLANTTLVKYLTTLDNKTDKAAQAISQLRAFDNYNWGYDPYHYTVPEGSYATDANGITRIIEFREMVQVLHNLGFRVVMDVVYNHTHQAGLAKHSVLDKIVPWYYHRLNPITGAIEQSTCCDNTATEHAMMAKLMTDSLVTWAKNYAIDGFRFDLMGHQPKQVMLDARKAVQQVDPDNYFYGEGWNFGEVANNQRFVQASQLELAGTEIGTFSDRLRDAVRGAGVGLQGFDIRKAQGLANGLGTAPNELNTSNNKLALYQQYRDQVRIGLTGNLANYRLRVDKNNQPITGKDIPYGDQPAGYALDPADTINYVSKHDNQTLWDNNQYRTPYYYTKAQRLRSHWQAMSYVLLAQGIPFMQMGMEFMRSKSFLRDSYDYGDWFNAVDFSMQNNNYNVGLPPKEKDQANWPLITQVLTQNQQRDLVTPHDIAQTNAIFNEWLKIRTSTPLFSLPNAELIQQKIHFLNQGEASQHGLIAMLIDDSQAPVFDTKLKQMLVLFNSNTKAMSFNVNNAQLFSLHPVQLQSADNSLKQVKITEKRITIPALTTVVLIQK